MVDYSTKIGINESVVLDGQVDNTATQMSDVSFGQTDAAAEVSENQAYVRAHGYLFTHQHRARAYVSYGVKLTEDPGPDNEVELDFYGHIDFLSVVAGAASTTYNMGIFAKKGSNPLDENYNEVLGTRALKEGTIVAVDKNESDKDFSNFDASNHLVVEAGDLSKGDILEVGAYADAKGTAETAAEFTTDIMEPENTDEYDVDSNYVQLDKVELSWT